MRKGAFLNVLFITVMTYYKVALFVTRCIMLLWLRYMKRFLPHSHVGFEIRISELFTLYFSPSTVKINK
jgi:hypothetical protein